GCGFGGSCFPKDVRALSCLAQSHGVEPRMLNAILSVNQDQPLRLIELLCKRMDIKGRTIGVLGLAFKPGTDDVREAPSLRVVEELMSRGAKVCVHDYRAMENFRKLFPQAMFCRSAKECIQRSDAIIILTEWPGYSDPSLYGDKLVIDGRGVTLSSNYEGVCW
ncbi:MAG: UDP binding domain-containing protein, partial [Methanomassiliicoccales archaeon]